MEIQMRVFAFAATALLSLHVQVVPVTSVGTMNSDS